ncbi:MAG: hypothetical protein JNM83_17420 [Myxococcales bacterium]|jgi:hypothetical protein|nr:hypothetical protein [Myxococcales bacterium]
MSNADIEELWIDAWNQLYTLRGERRDVVCLLPDGQRCTFEDCLGWLQDSVYAGYQVHSAEVWYQGRKAIQVSRSEPT